MRVYYLFFLFLLPALASAQLSRQDTLFFQSQTKPIRFWLDSLGLEIQEANANIATEVGKTYVSLHLRIGSGGEWTRASTLYTQKTKDGLLERDIYDKWRFLCDLSTDEAMLYIETAQHNYLIAGIDKQQFKIEYYDSEVKKDSTKAFTKESLRKAVPLDFSVPIVESEATEESNLAYYKERIMNFLRKYYENKGTKYCGKAVVTIESNLDNRLEVKVHNLSGEIFYDFSSRPYELIGLIFEITFTGKKAKFICKINGKYASGMSCYKPRNTEYKSVDFSYQSYVEEYAKKITNKLNEYLRKK